MYILNDLSKKFFPDEMGFFPIVNRRQNTIVRFERKIVVSFLYQSPPSWSTTSSSLT
jgi:hypothetical protein